MDGTDFAFAIVGSTPLAGLIAGLIAGETGAGRVCLVGERPSPLRLPRGIDLSVAAMTRPDSWALLAATLGETGRLLARIGGRGALVRLDPLLTAESAEGALALSHLRHLAPAYGVAVERAPLHALPGAMAALRLRDCTLIDRATLLPRLGPWLEAAGVTRLAIPEVRVEAVAGGARLRTAGAAHKAARLVLADDAAILSMMGAEAVAEWLEPEAATVVLTEPAAALAAPVMLTADHRVALMQRHGGNILALVGAGPVEAAGRLGVCLGAQAPLRRAGQTSFTVLASRDGAPVIGAIGRKRPHVIAGLGPAGAFLAPVLARQLAGRETAAERQWLDRRAPLPAAERAAIAEFGGPTQQDAAA